MSNKEVREKYGVPKNAIISNWIKNKGKLLKVLTIFSNKHKKTKESNCADINNVVFNGLFNQHGLPLSAPQLLIFLYYFAVIFVFLCFIIKV